LGRNTPRKKKTDDFFVKEKLKGSAENMAARHSSVN